MLGAAAVDSVVVIVERSNKIPRIISEPKKYTKQKSSLFSVLLIAAIFYMKKKKRKRQQQQRPICKCDQKTD